MAHAAKHITGKHARVGISAALLFITAALAGPPAWIIERDTTLDASVEITPTGVCEIRPGVTVRFDGYQRVTIRGVFIAQGTRDKPIVFTCTGRIRGSQDKPCWQGFEIIGKNSNAMFRHCRWEGAYRNLVWDSNPVFDSCEFVGNHFALYCTKKSAAHIKNCSIYRNRYGIVADFASPLVLDNVVTENTVGIYLQLSSRLIAGRNIITGNRTDIRSEECFGDNKDALSSKYLWDLMRQLY
jgi:parallel beta-helix repeat protein